MNSDFLREATASRRALLLGLAALAAAPLAGCDRGGPAVPELVMAAGVGRNAPSPDAPVGPAVQGLSAFGHRIMETAAKPGENFVASPLSLAVAFAMLRAGAAGVTAQELDTVFGFPATGRDSAFNAITQQLVTTDIPPAPDRKERKPGQPPKPPIVSIGNALFPQQGLPVGEAFLRTLAAEYGAGVRPLDFAAKDAIDLINGWAEVQTAGRIKKIFENLDANTKLVLANAVYFKADWQAFFPVTSTGPFVKEGGATVQAQTMLRSGTVRYAETGGVTAIELPYASGPYAMWLMLPPPGGKPEDTLNPAVSGQLRAAFAETQVEMAIPKWDFETGLDLKELLSGLGMPSAFGDGADFSAIYPGLFVSQAVHKANITVDEWGTEAAAVTGISMTTSAPPPPTVKFIADRPFGFAIVGGKDQVPLFLGRVSDPTAK